MLRIITTLNFEHCFFCESTFPPNPLHCLAVMLENVCLECSDFVGQMRTHTFLYMSTTFQFLYFHSWIHWREGIFQTGICLAVPFPKKAPQWGAADAEIKVSSGENTELKCFPFKAWSRSVYSHTWDAYCQGFLPCLFLPFGSIHLHFF